MRKINISLAILIFLSFVTPVNSVGADAAPPPAPAFGGPEPFHYQSTQVRMMYERVEMDVRQGSVPDDDTNSLLDQVLVTAWFVMHNTGTEDEKMEVAFPIGDFNGCLYHTNTPASWETFEILTDSFKVNVNGIPSKTEFFASKHPYADRDSCNDEMMEWAGFDVEFPTGKDVTIRVDYLMSSPFPGGDAMNVFQYILETGGGWKGTIGRANIIVHFPYTPNTENIFQGTTPGYQYLYDEIYWSFSDLEPTSENNITVAFVRPADWNHIQELASKLDANIHDVDSWLGLAESYRLICCVGHGIRSGIYENKMEYAYQRMMATNPINPEVYARYAQYLENDTYWFIGAEGHEQEATQEIFYYVSKALALDPMNETALGVLQDVRNMLPNAGFTPPPTIPPTQTFTPSLTPDVTPTLESSPTLTPPPTAIKFEITPTYTRTQVPTFTQRSVPILLPTGTSPRISPTPTKADNGEQQGNTSWLFGLVGILLIGSGFAGGWLAKSKKK